MELFQRFLGGHRRLDAVSDDYERNDLRDWDDDGEMDNSTAWELVREPEWRRAIPDLEEVVLDMRRWGSHPPYYWHEQTIEAFSRLCEEQGLRSTILLDEKDT